MVPFLPGEVKMLRGPTAGRECRGAADPDIDVTLAGIQTAPLG
jgi:hypothetical protein